MKDSKARGQGKSKKVKVKSKKAKVKSKKVVLPELETKIRGSLFLPFAFLLFTFKTFYFLLLKLFTFKTLR
jgi:hypothetical protein